MVTTPFNPTEAKEQLSETLARFQQEWEHGLSFWTVVDLCEAAEQADGVLTNLSAQDLQENAARLQVIQLRILLTTAKQALEAILEKVEAGYCFTVSDRRAPTPDTLFPAGTLLNCPQCGEGLYKVTREVSTAEIVLDDGAVVVPLNQSIPARDAWSTLACPLCGARLLKDGKIHTLQYGWT